MLIPQFLDDHGVRFETIYHAPAFTAQKRAKFLHVPGSQVAKCVLLYGPLGFFLAVLPATRRVDTEALGRSLGGDVRLANGEEVARTFPDCEWGVAAPFGTIYGLPSVLDESLAPETPMLLEGNTHVVAIRITCHDFERLEKPRRLSFAR